MQASISQLNSALLQTERDRERILEEKSRTYAALQAGKLYDDNNQYHVNFRPGGMLSEDLDPGTYTFDQRQRPDGIQAEISEGTGSQLSLPVSEAASNPSLEKCSWQKVLDMLRKNLLV